MSSFDDGPGLQKKITEAFKRKPTAKLAIAFWGEGALKLFGKQDLSGIEVICNLKMGGTNPRVVREMIARGANIYALDTLHAKFGVVADKYGFVGSSNASTNGLGLEGKDQRGWEELNVSFKSAAKQQQLKAKFDELLGTAQSLSDRPDLLDQAQKVWDERRHNLSMLSSRPARHKSLWDALLEDPTWFEDKPAYVAIYPTMDEDEKRSYFVKEEESNKRLNENLTYYWGWDDLPDRGVLLDLRKPTKGALAVEGYSQRTDEFPDDMLEGELFQAARKLDNFLGYPPLHGEVRKHFTQRFLEYARDKKLNIDEGAVIKFSDFAHYVSGQMKARKVAAK